jgi:hypothetical protein
LACCGVIPNDARLTIERPPKRADSPRVLSAQGGSALLNWLYLRGPYDIISFIGQRFDVEVPAKEDIGGNCEACAILFGDKAIADRIDEATALKADEIAGELSVLDALDWLDPGSVLSIWHKPGLIDTRQLHQSPVKRH